MLKYLISCREDGIVILENITQNNGAKKVLQLSQIEFGLLMSEPQATKEIITDRLWEMSGGAVGKTDIGKTVDIAYDILGRN